MEAGTQSGLWGRWQLAWLADSCTAAGRAVPGRPIVFDGLFI